MTTATKTLPAVRAPEEDQFAGDFADAPELREWVEFLIEKHPRFGFLRVHSLTVLWKKKGGGGDNPKMGKCTKPKGLVRHFSGADFVIWIAADHVRQQQDEAGWTMAEIEAMLFHELCHCSEDEDGNPTVVGHDFEGFAAEIQEHGYWTPALQSLEQVVQYRMSL